MSPKSQYKKCSNRLIIASFLMVAFMMASKFVYIAQRTELMEIFRMDDLTVNMGLTYYYVIYAITQLLLATFMHKINMKRYLSVSVIVSCILAGIMALSNGVTYFYIVLTLLGVFQAGIWAGCIHFLTKHLPACMLPKANTLLTCAFPVGTVVSYGIVALCTAFNSWQATFILVSALFLLVFVFFFISVSAIEKQPRHVAIEIDDEHQQRKGGFSTATVNTNNQLVSLDNKFAKVGYYIVVGIICFLVYFSYSSIIEYIPSMLESVHAMDKVTSKLLSIVVPLGVVFGPILMIKLCERYTNYYLVALIGGLILVPIGVAVALGYSVNFALAIFLLLVYALISRAVCSVFETVIVSRMKDQLNAGSFAAYTNATASIGAAASPAVMGLTIGVGWGFTYAVILGEIILLALLVLLLTIVFVRQPKRK